MIRGRVNREVVSIVVDIISDKVNKYRGRLLSFTARAELIRSVLESSAIYSMAIYKWPTSVIKECNSKIWNFLWSGNFEKRKLIMLKWDKMNRPCRDVGLGWRQLKDINLAMLIK